MDQEWSQNAYGQPFPVEVAEHARDLGCLLVGSRLLLRRSRLRLPLSPPIALIHACNDGARSGRIDPGDAPRILTTSVRDLFTGTSPTSP